MTGPEQAPPPSVSTAPAEGAAPATASPRAPLGWSRLPAHVGPARTSTVLLAVAFVAIGVLYLFVKPPATGPAGAVTDPAPGTSRSVAPTTSAPAGTTAPERTTAPEETAPEETPPEETAAPTSEVGPTTSEDRDDGTGEETAPFEETSVPAPTTGVPEPPPATPTS